MKKSVLYALAASVMVLASCNDMLDKSPRSEFSNNPTFWSNANSVESYSNTLYENYSGYGQGGSGGWFYFKSLSDDQANPNFDNWTFTSVPNTSSYWSSPFEEIRRCNYLIEGMAISSLADGVKKNYEAVARLNRAWQYFQLVREYGDVQWYEKVVLDPNNEEEVNQPRTDRDVVMDNIVADLDFAIENLTTVKAGNAWSKHMALAMKSDVCLFEGTYCKYRTQEDNGKPADAARAQKYLQLAVAASQELMNAGYALSANYGDVYNSLNLNGNPEVIFWRNYHKDVLGHSTVDYTTGSTAQRGITKDAVDAFLFRDGKPLATTSLDTDDKAELDKTGHYSIKKMLANRDKRLSVIIDSIVCFKGHGWPRDPQLAEMTSSTAYTIAKYDNALMGTDNPTLYRNGIGSGYTDAPIFWISVVYLNYAEAKAELGTLTQEDLNNTVNKLLARGEVPALTLTPAADPANNHGVSNLLWEIRRCRRCELMTDNWYRYWDLVRWHQLDKLDSNKYPNINRGANLSNVPNCEVALDGGYVIATSATRTFDKKHYFWPIPQQQITLGNKTTQNDGWK
ncbi:MAG: RagB/SusD family nutrient uptake outer membrane protein [bacterium]|nr:RagB/SusD family nutrient uptake outer membrane protein [bacterium]